MRRGALAALAAVAVSLAISACGGGGGGGGNAVPPPHGPPTLRHPAADVAAAQAAEEMRAQLVAASSLYGVGRRADARAHVNAAQTSYAGLTRLVRRRDAVLDREISAAFGVIAGQIARKEAPPQVTLRMGLVQGQLLDAAISDAVSLPARNDPTVAAQVLDNLASQGLRDYLSAVRHGPATPIGSRAFQDSFGLLSRAVTVAHQLGAAFGPEKSAVTGSVGAAHNDGFPLGVLVPKTLQPAKVTADVRRMRAAVAKRFRLGQR